jgi:hypothetical protein
MAPDSPYTRAFVRLFWRWRERGASPYYAPQQRSLLREAGFGRCEAFTVAECIATPEATHHMAGGLIELLSGAMGAAWVEQGWADSAQVEELIAGIRSWGQAPDALWAALQIAAVGWAD